MNRYNTMSVPLVQIKSHFRMTAGLKCAFQTLVSEVLKYIRELDYLPPWSVFHEGVYDII